jgi:hypothetical protein
MIFPRKSRVSDGYPDYVLQIFNEEGGMIDEVSDADLRGEMIENSFAFMRSLYDLA